eukprot:GHRQ01017568.1.p1 GENE.GHRQ01017568.1~~GHRQ01017568.1.p1  ORF type:complete len:136 (-),score=14.26 GHRQ01017568.1:715-1122(-)
MRAHETLFALTRCITSLSASTAAMRVLWRLCVVSGSSAATMSLLMGDKRIPKHPGMAATAAGSDHNRSSCKPTWYTQACNSTQSSGCVTLGVSRQLMRTKHTVQATCLLLALSTLNATIKLRAHCCSHSPYPTCQ